MAKKDIKIAQASAAEPVLPLLTFASGEKIAKANTTTRRNRSTTIQPTDKYKNIQEGLSPFISGDYGSSTITVREAIKLCQKAHYNFSIFRHTVELMTEFSVAPIYYKGGNSKSRAFFEALFNKIGIWGLQDQFYRENYRSGNIFLYRQDGKVKDSDVSKITQTFGLEAKASVNLPLKYIILNPADIHCVSGASFVNGVYQKLLSNFELAALKSPKTQEDKDLLNSFPKDIQDRIKNSSTNAIYIPLNLDNVYFVFYKKQSYEAFAVPSFYCVLADLEFKEELKKCDMAIARVTQQSLLLVTSGATPENGGVNQKVLNAIQELLSSESVGKVLVADYTTRAEFILPKISDLLDPRKYETINKDISVGLHNILLGDEKFANQSIQLQMFVERLKHARQTFINDFLLPEIKRISEELGFKNYPTPYYQEFDLKNELEYAKIYTRLAELGILTPEETVNAIETSVLPNAEDSVAAQTKLKQYHKDELYMPLATFGGQGAADAPNGRPGGSKAPQSTKKVAPIGASYSVKAMKEVVANVSSLTDKVKSKLLSTYKIKKLSPKQTELAEEVTEIIIANENMENWEMAVEGYIKNPVDKNSEKVDEILSIAAEHGLDEFSASLLFHCKK